MSNDQFKLFQEKYPNLFKKYPICGFHLPKGWETLVHNLCIVLEDHISRLPEDLKKDITCDQVKEKFSSLRFYMSCQDDYISGAIAMAENMSGDICETCGEPGKTRSGGWMVTLCDKHHQERKKKT